MLGTKELRKGLFKGLKVGSLLQAALAAMPWLCLRRLWQTKTLINYLLMP
jgi:hypothetical protein